MGFAVASKGAPLASLLKKLLLPAPAASALGPRSVAGRYRLFNTGPGFSYPAERRTSWVSKEDADALEFKVAMLGMPKEQVKLSAYPDGLLVMWEDAKGSDGEEPAWHSWSINLSTATFKLEQTKAEMRDGLLTVTVPKIKGEVREFTDIKID